MQELRVECINILYKIQIDCCHQMLDFKLSGRDYVTFGSLLSQIRLSSVTFVCPTQRLKLSALFYTCLYVSYPLASV